MAQVRERAVARRRLIVELAAASMFAAVTALGARLCFHLPFTPVPVTGQVFCVLLAGGVLGARLGFASQVGYLAAGAAGLPVFAHGGGLVALLGPTGGYLAGFPIAAGVVGLLCGRRGVGGGRAFAACLAGVVAIYLFGATWFAIWQTAVGSPAPLLGALYLSVFPFVAVDVTKAALVAAVLPGLARRFPLT